MESHLLEPVHRAFLFRIIHADIYRLVLDGKPGQILHLHSQVVHVIRNARSMSSSSQALDVDTWALSCTHLLCLGGAEKHSLSLLRQKLDDLVHLLLETLLQDTVGLVDD